MAARGIPLADFEDEQGYLPQEKGGSLKKRRPHIERRRTATGIIVVTYGDGIRVTSGDRGVYDRVVSFRTDGPTMEHQPTKDGLVYACGIVSVAERIDFPNLSRELQRKRGLRGPMLEALDARTYEEVEEISLEYWDDLHA
jgi:hypothetical protein